LLVIWKQDHSGIRARVRVKVGVGVGVGVRVGVRVMVRADLEEGPERLDLGA